LTVPLSDSIQARRPLSCAVAHALRLKTRPIKKIDRGCIRDIYFSRATKALIGS
jgi:hypothetical protein